MMLDVCDFGRRPRRGESDKVRHVIELLERVLIDGDGAAFGELIEQLRLTGFGQTALLDSKEAWTAMEQAYQRLLPTGPLIDFFWSWRFLVRSVLAVAHTRLPDARLFHAVATGFAGIVGSFARLAANKPLLVTEHGIYTNERRIELAVADWLFDSDSTGFEVATDAVELRTLWIKAFNSFSRIGYDLCDSLTTQYRANQTFQLADGAPQGKLRIIPNGIDVSRYALPRNATKRPPTVLMVGRVVPIKDIRTFIMSIALLREMVPDVLAILIGPEDEDPEYAASCRQLVVQLGAESSIQFLGRVPDVLTYLISADVLALSSISEAQPLAVLEAAATALPIVSTDVGSCREIIEGFDDDPVKGLGGLVVEPCNPKAMADALATILRDDALRASMAEVMRRRVASYYHKNRVTRLYEGLYAEFMTAGAPAAERRAS